MYHRKQWLFLASAQKRTIVISLFIIDICTAHCIVRTSQLGTRKSWLSMLDSIRSMNCGLKYLIGSCLNLILIVSGKVLQYRAKSRRGQQTDSSSTIGLRQTLSSARIHLNQSCLPDARLVLTRLLLFSVLAADSFSEMQLQLAIRVNSNCQERTAYVCLSNILYTIGTIGQPIISLLVRYVKKSA